MQIFKKETLNSLYDKTESRIKDLHSFRQLLISIKNFEDFGFNKLKFTQFFFDIEDDLREFLQNSKSAYFEIKKLEDQLELFINRFEIVESKYKISDQYAEELKYNIKECLNHIKFQDNLKLNSDKYIIELEKKIKILENEIKILKTENLEKSKDLTREVCNILNTQENLNRNSVLYSNSNKLNPSNIINQVNNNSNILKTITQENFDKEEIKKTDYSNPLSTIPNNANMNNLNFHLNQNNKNNEAVRESMDSSTIYKIKEKLDSYQYNDMMTERENSKKLINDFIRESLNFNYNDNNRIIKNSNLNANKRLDINDENSNISNYYLNTNLNNNLSSPDRKIITFGKDEEDKNSINENYKNNNLSGGSKNINRDSEILNFNESHKLNQNLEYKDAEEYKEKNLFQREAKKTFVNAAKIENQNFSNSEFKMSKEKFSQEIACNENTYNKADLNNKIQKNEDKNKSIMQNKMPRADKILQIIHKIKNSEDISSIVVHLFGEDILNEIITPNVDDELIEKVDATIQEIERLMQKEEFTDTEPQYNSYKKPERHPPSIIEEKEEEFSTFMNNTLSNKENSNNLINHQLNEFVNNKNPNFTNFPSFKNLNKNSDSMTIKTVNEELTTNKVVTPKSNSNNNENKKQNFISKVENETTNSQIKSPLNQNKKDLLHDLESKYTLTNNFHNLHTIQNTYTIPNLNTNNNNNISNNNINWQTQNNVINRDDNNYFNFHNTNTNNVSSDFLNDNNYRRSDSKLRRSFNSNSRSLSKPKKEIFSPDSAAASKINFEKSLRNYEDYNKESAEIHSNRMLKTHSNLNKKNFNNYMKNKGDLFDNNIYKQSATEFECRRKNNYKQHTRLKRDENSKEIKSLKEMQRFKELYEKFKHLALGDQNNNDFSSSHGNMNRSSNFFKNKQKETNNLKQGSKDGLPNKSNTNIYLFNDDL